ncbi:MAG: methyltransferase family protein, partial [bacterium]
WRRAWLLMAVLFVPMFAAGLVMLFKSPELLRKRLSAKEAQPEQRRVVAASGAMFVTAFLLAGLGRRFGWPTLPDIVSWGATAVFLLGYALYAEVLRENVWLSRTVEVQANQKVVDTGLYGVVRHPMYLSTLLLFLAMPLILGSIPAFIVTLAYIPIIRRRIISEEAVLAAGLAGYAEYTKRVRYRLIPCIW